MPKNNLARKQTIKKALNNTTRSNKTCKKNSKSCIDYELKHKEATTSIRRDFFKLLIV